MPLFLQCVFHKKLVCSVSHLCLVQIFGGKRPELQMLVELISDAKDFSLW